MLFLNATLILNVTLPLLCPLYDRKHTFLPLLMCVCTAPYCTLNYSRAEAQKAPIISPHTFEEVEVSHLNAKQDPQGLGLGLRQCSLLLTLFQDREFGKDSHFNNKATDFSHVALRVSLSHSDKASFFLSFESTNRPKALRLSIIIDVLSVH